MDLFIGPEINFLLFFQSWRPNRPPENPLPPGVVVVLSPTPPLGPIPSTSTSTWAEETNRLDTLDTIPEEQDDDFSDSG